MELFTAAFTQSKLQHNKMHKYVAGLVFVQIEDFLQLLNEYMNIHNAAFH